MDLYLLKPFKCQETYRISDHLSIEAIYMSFGAK